MKWSWQHFDHLNSVLPHISWCEFKTLSLASQAFDLGYELSDWKMVLWRQKSFFLFFIFLFFFQLKGFHIRGRIPVSTVTEFHCGDKEIPQGVA